MLGRTINTVREAGGTSGRGKGVCYFMYSLVGKVSLFKKKMNRDLNEVRVAGHVGHAEEHSR